MTTDRTRMTWQTIMRCSKIEEGQSYRGMLCRNNRRHMLLLLKSRDADVTKKPFVLCLSGAASRQLQ